MELPYDSAILLLVIYLKKSKNVDLKRSCTLEKNTYTLLFITALFIIAKIRKQPLCLSTDEWINRCGMHTHTMEYYSVIKRTKCCHVQQHEYTWRVSAKTYRRRQIGYHLYVESKKYNNRVCVYVCVWLNDTDWLFATPWTVAHQAPLSMEFSGQEYWRVAISYSRGSFQLWDQTCASCISRQILYHWAMWEALYPYKLFLPVRKYIYIYLYKEQTKTSWLFEKIFKINKPFVKITKQRERWQIANNKNERRIITTSSTDIKMIAKNTINNLVITNSVT